MYRTFILILLFLFLLPVSLFADDLDDFTKDIKTYKKTTLKLDGFYQAVYYKVYKEKILPDGSKKIFYILKDDILKDTRAYLKVIYSTREKEVNRMGLDEYVQDKIKNRNKSILVKIWENDDYQTLKYIVENFR